LQARISLVLLLSNPITVGICAFNEGKNIGPLLDNILTKQNLSERSEVLLVCSGCTDNTVDMAKVYSAKDSRVTLFLENERKGKASAVNKIFVEAKNEIILFVSADTLPKEGGFSKLTKKLQNLNVGIVSGNPVPTNNSDTLVGKIVALLWGFHSHVFAELNDAGLARHATEIFCIRKGIVKEIPTETVNDDAYIAVVAKSKGWLIKYSAEAQVSICGPKTFQEYFQQRRRIIFGHYQLRKLTGESPQYLVHMMPLHPISTMKLILWLLLKYDPMTVSFFLFTEFTVNLAAIFDFVSGKTYFQWRPLPSTKTVLTQI
jgi:cellulose synthase/poly-beta-1,6-N-acetylglucosamine synthase-like glycosyltransferase